MKGLSAGHKLAIALGMLCLSIGAAAAPHLHCDVVYAGASHAVDADPGGDPYTTKSVDIAGRFAFKAVMLGSAERLDAIKLYAYYQTRRQNILIQETRYLPPFRYSDVPGSLSGHQYLYAPPLGRELQYGCALTEGKP